MIKIYPSVRGGATVVGSVWLLLHSFNSRSGRSFDLTRYGYPSFRNGQYDVGSQEWSNGAKRRKNIVIASSFPFHFDVYMAAAKTIGDVLDSNPVDAPGTIHIYAPDFLYGFQDIVDELDLWKHRGIRGQPADLAHLLNSETGEAGVELIVFGTCETDLGFWHNDLVDAWDRRDADHKFKIVCIVHNILDTNWQRHITHWARRDAIRLLPIANHVKDSFRESFDSTADSSDLELHTAGYQYIPIDVHVPILDIPDLPIKPVHRDLVTAVIQGTLVGERRDYHRFFNDLIASLYEDAAAWGYRPLNSGASVEPDNESNIAPFRLLLVGSGGIEIPAELALIVSVHHDLSYKDFYNLVAMADMVVPAFAQFGYFRDQASSTVALATELNVPLLATDRLRRTYGYIDDARAVVTRPAAMSEVQALKALRTGNASSFLESDPAHTGVAMGEVKGVRDAVERMLEEGWVRDRKGWMDWRESVWERNLEVMDRVLKDMP